MLVKNFLFKVNCTLYARGKKLRCCGDSFNYRIVCDSDSASQQPITSRIQQETQILRAG